MLRKSLKKKQTKKQPEMTQSRHQSVGQYLSQALCGAGILLCEGGRRRTGAQCIYRSSNSLTQKVNGERSTFASSYTHTPDCNNRSDRETHLKFFRLPAVITN